MPKTTEPVWKETASFDVLEGTENISITVGYLLLCCRASPHVLCALLCTVLCRICYTCPTSVYTAALCCALCQVYDYDRFSADDYIAVARVNIKDYLLEKCDRREAEHLLINEGASAPETSAPAFFKHCWWSSFPACG